MKSILHYSILILFACIISSAAVAQKEKDNSTEKLNTRVDNNGYWKKMAKKGLTTLNPMVDVPQAKYTGSAMETRSSITLDSPDVPVTKENSFQSENSIFIDPTNSQVLLNSNNSSANPYPPSYGANDLYSFDGGFTWQGEIQGAGVDNTGDPAVVIGHNGWWYVNHIIDGSNLGQQLAYSQDQGANWTLVTIDPGTGSFVLDKNHFWIDNNLSSPYEGNLYCAWTDISGPNNNDIGFSYSSDGGLSWSSTVNISSAINAGSHCQGVNINTGPNGEVYAMYAVYDAWPEDENAYGISKSLDGGESWEPATRILENVRGIRNTETSKNMRVNSFPSMTVDNSNGPYSGNLYMVWANVGIPGINADGDIDVYIIRSDDEGDTWSTPIKVNQDASGMGKEHYFPWITCDPVTGNLSVVFYDDRNVGSNECEVFCANSFDGGNTWEDFKVSDVSFTPSPIPGFASGYMGDYLGITALDSYVYPCWTDNRTGSTMTYVSPYNINTLARPFNLVALLDDPTGSVDLEWHYTEEAGFTHFILYRDGTEIGQTSDTTYTDQLPDYGPYTYTVTAYYNPDGESPPAAVSIQWGDAHIFVSPPELTQTLAPDETAMQYLSITNTGELDLEYDVSTLILTDKDSKDYCPGSGGCDEYISQVQFGDINNTSTCGGYEDYTNLSTEISVGETIPITITNGNSYTGDEVGIWIDWNQNEDFSDDDLITVTGGPDFFTADISVPDNAIGGLTRMRIRMVFDDTPIPCGTTIYGEVEDYSVNVNTWLSLSHSTGTVLPGASDQIEVTFDATDMALGTYTAELTVNCNDPDLPEVLVPVTMIVSEFGITAMADPSELCIGESTQLDCNVFGGGGSYAYIWTSDPPGFNSTLQNPSATPLENTTYYVEASDGNDTSTGSVFVAVHELPAVSIGPDTTFCDWQVVVLDPGPGFTSYAWQDGSTNQTYIPTESGIYWVEVSDGFGCFNSDSTSVTINMTPAQPAKPAGPALVDLYAGYVSDYVTTDFPGTVSYDWILNPASAGTIQINAYEANIEWEIGFMGQAELKVMATNSCGSSIWSDSLTITVTNSTGIGDLEQNLGVVIYPNPNKGVFTLELESKDNMYINLHIYNSSNALVYQEDNLRLSGRYTDKIDLSNLATGIYSLRIESKQGVLSRQIIIGE